MLQSKLKVINKSKFCNCILKLTQFCKEIKQQNLQSKVQLITSCQGWPYLVLIHLSMEKKPKNRSSIKPRKNPLGRAFKKTVFKPGIDSCHRVSVCPSICLSHVGVLRRWPNVGSRKRRHSLLTPKVLAKFWWAHPQWGRQIKVGWVKTAIFNQYLAISQKRRNSAVYENT